MTSKINLSKAIDICIMTLSDLYKVGKKDVFLEGVKFKSNGWDITLSLEVPAPKKKAKTTLSALEELVQAQISKHNYKKIYKTVVITDSGEIKEIKIYE